ncbi:MAG: sulfatase-like hydrolase/transferase [Aureliella sp.]
MHDGRRLLTLIFVTWLTVADASHAASPESDQPAERPNVILVMADDQGWGDVGYNGHPFVQTPHLDTMAREACVLDRFYAAAPVCSPTRASVMTGRNPIRGKVTNHGRYLRPHEQTIAESLKAAGYATGIFGKVHLGSGQPDSPCNPSGMGFDEWVIGLNFFDNDPYLSCRGIVEQRKGKGSVIAMDDAIEFLRKHRGGEAPVFMVVWFPSPHDPHQEVPEGRPLYVGKKQAGYYREITLLDQQLGRLRRELRNMEMAHNTILWYCSDNGGLNEATSGGRERKGSVYEGGLRVPSIIEWPAEKLSGRTSVPLWTCDIYPTVLAMAGVELDARHPLDGIDVSQIIRGVVKKRERAMGFWHKLQPGQSAWSDRILRSIMQKQHAGDPLPHNAARMQKDVDEFPQFALDTATGHAAWNDWPWKLHQIDGTEFELYNLAKDPMEQSDLSQEAEQRDRVAVMKRELRDWMHSVIGSLNGRDYQWTDGTRPY